MVGSLLGRDTCAGSAVMIGLFLIGSILPLGWAQDGNPYQISISADRKVVTSGEKITVTGRVLGLGANESPLIRVFAPNGAMVRADPLDVDADGNYSYELVLGGIANLVGDYKIVVSYGPRQAETFVRFDTSKSPTCTNYFFSGLPPSWALMVENRTYIIEYLSINATVRDMDANIQRKSIIIGMTVLGNGCLIVLLPTEVIDAENRNFTAYVDGQPAVFREIEDNRNDTRALFIPLRQGDGQVEIVGTRVVPEFNPVVLAGVITGLIVPVFLLRWTILRSPCKI